MVCKHVVSRKVNIAGGINGCARRARNLSRSGIPGHIRYVITLLVDCDGIDSTIVLWQTAPGVDIYIRWPADSMGRPFQRPVPSEGTPKTPIRMHLHVARIDGRDTEKASLFRCVLDGVLSGTTYKPFSVPKHSEEKIGLVSLVEHLM
jgi:hypothetical protein